MVTRWQKETKPIVGTKTFIDEVFTYHSPTPKQTEAYVNIRAKAKELAEVIYANTPPSADQTAAIRKLRECVMTANAAIALEGLV